MNKVSHNPDIKHTLDPEELERLVQGQASDAFCGNEHYEGLVCTMPKHHRGPHAGGSGLQNPRPRIFGVWENDEAPDFFRMLKKNGVSEI